MSPFEIGIIVLVCCLPIVALILILPKQLKKKASKPTEAKQEPAKETPKPVEIPQKETSTKENAVDKDMQSYLDRRKTSHPAPTAKTGNLNEFGRYNPDLFRRPTMPSGTKKQEDKPIADQINDLSPELKAIILTGALNRKNFDEDNNT